MELSYKEFKVLYEIMKNGYSSQKAIAENIELSVGTVNKIIRKLYKAGFLEEKLLTSLAYKELEFYKVDNAVILSAGKSSRFLPITYDVPKGLIVVNGERIIERIIKQLHDVGISNITLVVGYMAEKYFYLKEKYGVDFVGNNQYAIKNNFSSLYYARNKLQNTYVCNSDNYYVSNPFNSYEYRSYFTVHYVEESNDDRGVQFDSSGLIYSTNKPAKNQWATTGHAFVRKEFWRDYIDILEEYMRKPGKENYFWESVYAENIGKLSMYVKKCEYGNVLEFDKLSDLYEYNPHYMLSNDFSVIKNICNILGCKPEDVRGFDRMLGGFTNDTFRFAVNDKKYTYRRPGDNSKKIINRKREAVVTDIVAKLGIDNTTIYIEPEQGWKISEYFNEVEKFSYDNPKHKKGLADKLHLLHDDIHLCGYQFNLYDEAIKIIELIKDYDLAAYTVLLEYRPEIHLINSFLITDQWPISLCHNDAKSNICVTDDGFRLIDWEYGGDTDIGFDLCKLYYAITPNFDDMKHDLSLYFQREPSFEEIRHLIGCVAVCDYYWFVWNIWQSKGGKELLDDSIFHFQRMCSYKKVALDLYSNKTYYVN